MIVVIVFLLMRILALSIPARCGGQRRVRCFLKFLRPSARRAIRPQLLYRHHHFHKRLWPLVFLRPLLVLPIRFMWRPTVSTVEPSLTPASRWKTHVLLNHNGVSKQKRLHTPVHTTVFGTFGSISRLFSTCKFAPDPVVCSRCTSVARGVRKNWIRKNVSVFSAMQWCFLPVWFLR